MTVWQKERIVTKAGTSAWLIQNAPLARAFEETRRRQTWSRLGSIPSGPTGNPKRNFSDRDDTTEASRPQLRRQAGEKPEQFRVVVRVGGVPITAAIQSGKTRGMDTGRAAEGVNFEPGIVREDEHSA